MLITFIFFMGYASQTMASAPDDTGKAGSSIVGARTVKIKNLDVEIWYPALPSPTENAKPKIYDIRDWLPLAEQDKVPDDKAPLQVCDCFADLPLDSEQGPYPLIIFAHGSAAFRTQSLSLMTHLASRGFVVVAADHPGLYLGDLLRFKLQPTVTADLKTVLAALHNDEASVSFLKDQLAFEQIGLIGHSFGGFAISDGGEWPGVGFIASMAAGGTQTSRNLKGSLILGGLDDKVVTYKLQQAGYSLSPSPKRFIGIKNAGHLAFSDLCALKNDDGDDLLAVAKKYRVTNAIFAGILWDGCDTGQTDPFRARQILNTSIAAAAEEALLGIDRTGNFKNMKTRFEEIAEFKEKL